MDKKTITIVVGIIVGFIVLRWIYLYFKNRNVPFWQSPYEKVSTETASAGRAGCRSYGGGKVCCPPATIKFNNQTNEHECIGSDN